MSFSPGDERDTKNPVTILAACLVGLWVLSILFIRCLDTRVPPPTHCLEVAP